MLCRILLQDTEKVAPDTFQIAATCIYNLYESDFVLAKEYKPYIYGKVMPVIQYSVNNVNLLGDHIKLNLCNIIADLEGVVVFDDCLN